MLLSITIRQKPSRVSTIYFFDIFNPTMELRKNFTQNEVYPKFINIFLQSAVRCTTAVKCAFYQLLEYYNPAIYGVLYQSIALQNLQPISLNSIIRLDPLKKLMSFEDCLLNPLDASWISWNLPFKSTFIWMLVFHLGIKM